MADTHTDSPINFENVIVIYTRCAFLANQHVTETDFISSCSYIFLKVRFPLHTLIEKYIPGQTANLLNNRVYSHGYNIIYQTPLESVKQ